jgi:hypothetical protein
MPYLRSRLLGDYEVELLSKHDPTKRKGEEFFGAQRAALNRWVRGLPDFSWSKHTKTGNVYQMTTNYTKLPYIIPNGHKLDHMAVK